MSEERSPIRGGFPDNRRAVSTDPAQEPNLYAEKTEMFNAPPLMPPDQRSQHLPYPLSNTNSSERNNPAYIVFLIALVLVILSGGVFTVVAISLFRQSTSSPSDTQNGNQANVYQTAPPQSAQIQGTVDAHPTFTVPAGTPGNTISSQPPQTGVPTFAAPTATPAPTATSTPLSNGLFTLQVVSYPQQVNNRSLVQVQVHAGQPRTTVQLSANYLLPPYFYKSQGQITDDNGDATIDWPINLSTPIIRRDGATSTTAHFTVLAQGPDGQIATASGSTIQIILR
jgi:hypothetical protein